MTRDSEFYSYVWKIIYLSWWEKSSGNDEKTDKRFLEINTKLVDHSSTDNNCVITEHNGEIFIAFRGTENGNNILSHFNVLPRHKILGMKFHRGWFENYKSLEKNILDTLEQYKDRKINIVGHSMGGALAGIAAIMLILKRFNVVSLTQFGCPKYANERAIKFIDKCNIDTELFINANDYLRLFIPFMHRHPVIRLGKKVWWKIWSSKDHLPWSSNKSDKHYWRGYIDGLIDYKGFDINNWWKIDRGS